MRFGWLVFICVIILPDVPIWCQGTPAFYMGKGKTGEKPQAKVWHHNGFWWCLLPGTADGQTGLRFYKVYDGTWRSVGELVDPREQAQADVWSEGDDLFVLIFHRSEARFLAFRFDQSLGGYEIQDGFPVSLSPLPVAGIETMSLRCDGKGRFWVAFEGEAAGAKRGEIWAIWSDDGLRWHLDGVRLGTGVDRDDIVALCRFTIRGTGYLGAIWSQQAVNKSSHRDTAGVGRLVMRVHQDGDHPAQWSPIEIIASGQAIADDHLNTAVARDGSVYVVTKTSLDDLRPRDRHVPLLMVYARDTQGGWTGHPVSLSDERGTRPIVVLDGQRGILHVFYTRPANQNQSVREIAHRWAARDRMQFSEAEVAIGRAGVYLNDATSTHQDVTQEEGIVVMCWGAEPQKKTPNRAFFRVYKLDSG